MEGKVEKVLFTKEEIEDMVKEMGMNISRDYKGKDLLIISLLKGAFVFTADLVREITVPVEIDFITTSSYGSDEESSGDVKFLTDITLDIEGRDVLLVDDIMDTGYTMEKVTQYIESKNPKSIKVCTMLDKPSRRKVDLEPDYVGFVIPDLFIVGYGLNYDRHYRNTPYIFAFE